MMLDLLLLAWLVRAPTLNPGVATATVVGLVLGAILRLLAWYSVEYRLSSDELRLEAGFFLVLSPSS